MILTAVSYVIDVIAAGMVLSFLAVFALFAATPVLRHRERRRQAAETRRFTAHLRWVSDVRAIADKQAAEVGR